MTILIVLGLIAHAHPSLTFGAAVSSNHTALNQSAKSPDIANAGVPDETPDGCLKWDTLFSDTPGIDPMRRTGLTAINDQRRQRLVVFGGSGDAAHDFPYLNDVWGFSPSDKPNWFAIEPTGPRPRPREWHSAIFDPVRTRMIVFGGYYDYMDPDGAESDYFLNDVWALALDGTPTWTKLDPIGTPPSERMGHVAVYDPVRNRMIVIGGRGASVFYNDVWALSLAGGTSWAQLNPGGTPPPGVNYRQAAAVYDPIHDQVVLTMGGTDVWLLSLTDSGSWSHVVPEGDRAPSIYGIFAGVYDARMHRMLVASGELKVAALSLDDRPRWTMLDIDGAHPEHMDGSAAFDMAHDQLIIVCGYSLGYQSNAVSAMVPALDQVRLTTFVEPNSDVGSVIRSPAKSCYAMGDTVILTAEPHGEAIFLGWGGDASGTTNPLTVVMNRQKEIFARFDSGITAVLLSQFDATGLEGGIELRWQFAEPERVGSVAVDRAENLSGPWSSPTLEMREERAATVALDQSVEPEREYWYRLRVGLRDGPSVMFGPVSVHPRESVLVSSITRVEPNPSSGKTLVQYAVALPGRVELVVVDVAGRKIAGLLDTAVRPGRYSLIWNGIGDGGRLRAGTYFVRLTAPDRVVTRKVVILF